MTRYLIGALFILVLFASAKAEALSYAPSTWQYCPSIAYDLTLGSQDYYTASQVTQLQMFLAQDRSIYTSGLVTGYFGYNTRTAVQNFQNRFGIASAWSTGYGVAGPQTRAKIASLCYGGGYQPAPNPNPNPGYCTLEYSPVCGQKTTCQMCITTPCTGCYLQQKTYSNTCMLQQDGAQLLHYGACSGTGDSHVNRPPTISSFSGPTTLNVNQLGTWSISASDPESGQLTYDINWGDEPVYAYAATSMRREQFTQSTTFQHSYAAAGTYTVTITVRDSAGKSVTSSTTLRVDEVYYSQPEPWPYWNYNNNYYDNYYDNYYNYNSWDLQNPYGWDGWNNWGNNQNNYWNWQY